MAKTKTLQKTTSKGTTWEEYKTLTREELDKLAGEPLPERAALSLINANIAAPVNAAFVIPQQEADITEEN
jgi:hypothetical protein